jgi:hypothetical protein
MLGRLWGRNRLPINTLWGGFGVALMWLWVALGGLTAPAPNHRKRGHSSRDFLCARENPREGGFSQQEQGRPGKAELRSPQFDAKQPPPESRKTLLRCFRSNGGLASADSSVRSAMSIAETVLASNELRQERHGNERYEHGRSQAFNSLISLRLPAICLNILLASRHKKSMTANMGKESVELSPGNHNVK